jgi:Ca-activated chloride channel family protein
MLPGFAPRIDTRPLELLSEKTGGKFFRADDARSLEEIYQQIDRLERSDVESLRFVDYREIYAWFVAAALGLIALEVALRSTVFRRLP